MAAPEPLTATGAPRTVAPSRRGDSPGGDARRRAAGHGCDEGDGLAESGGVNAGVSVAAVGKTWLASPARPMVRGAFAASSATITPPTAPLPIRLGLAPVSVQANEHEVPARPKHRRADFALAH